MNIYKKSIYIYICMYVYIYERNGEVLERI